MSRPTLEVADIVRAAGNRFWEHHGSHLAWQHRKVLDAIVRCRTAALGGHRDQCVRCGHQAISYNSCRNRHCPRCQGNARSRWLAERRAELLPVLVLSRRLHAAARALRSSPAEQATALRSAVPQLAQRRCSNWPATRSIWVQTSGFLVFSTLGDRTFTIIRTYTTSFPPAVLLPTFPMDPLLETILPARRALSRVFQGKFVAGLKQLFLQHKLQFHGSLQSLG